MHTVRHNEFVVNILEGAIFGKKVVGRPWLQYLKQVARNTAADSYTAVKRMACNSCRWRTANQSDEWWDKKKEENESLWNFKLQNCDMKQVPYWGTTILKWHVNLLPGTFCYELMHILICRRKQAENIRCHYTQFTLNLLNLGKHMFYCG